MHTAGSVGILNVGAGDTKLSFNNNDPQETIRAARIVKDMIRHGYALLVQLPDGGYRRATDFDEGTAEYIIADYDPTVTDDEDDQHGKAQTTEPSKGASGITKKTTKRRVKAANASAVAVAKTAGG